MATRKRPVIVLALVLILIFTWTPWAQDSARQQATDGLNRALATYATARAINALISVAQSTQVSVQPAGVGIATHPGEALDPVNDLVEQFSSLMLLASVAFGVQLLLIKAGAHAFVSVALSFVAIAWCVVCFSRLSSPQWLTKALVLLLLVRFAVPASVVASEQTYRALFESQYQESVNVLKSAPTNDESAPSASLPSVNHPASRSSWKDWVPSFKNAPAEEKEPADKVDGVVGRMQAFVKVGVEHVVTLAALFVVQTLVLPLVFLGVLLTALRQVGLRPLGRLASSLK
jgi:hypothetical protein